MIVLVYTAMLCVVDYIIFNTITYARLNESQLIPFVIASVLMIFAYISGLIMLIISPCNAINIEDTRRQYGFIFSIITAILVVTFAMITKGPF